MFGTTLTVAIADVSLDCYRSWQSCNLK